MSEQRLIDANALLEVLEQRKRLCIGVYGDLGGAISGVIKLIDNAQAVDLWQMRQEATENALKKAEILYDRPKGEWIKEPNGKTTDIYRCSICGRSILLCKNADLSKYPFCHCGADMRGDQK